MTEKVVLYAKGICMDFSGVRVLHDVDLRLEAGKIYGIIGENGAGKSTLMRILSGFLQPVEGEIYVDGQKIVLNPLKAKELGIILVPQELNLVETLRVYENIFLGDEESSAGFLKKRSMIQKASELIQKLGLSVDPRSFVEELSPAQKQMVEIAKAVSKKVRILIMDEPTSSLSEEEVSKLFEIVRNMKKTGTAVVFISHKLKEVKTVADHLIVLRDGRKVYDGELAALSEREMAELMIGRKLSDMYPPKTEHADQTILEVKNLTTIDRKVQDICFELKKGEILGFYGLVGSGRTELMQALIGVRKIKSGEILIDGKKVEINSPKHAKNLGIVYLPEDRKSGGIITDMETFKNSTLMSLDKISKFFTKLKKELGVFERYVKSFDIKIRHPLQPIKTLSGGNQQKVVISKLVETGAKVFIFDEPTRGVDVNTKRQIYEIIHSMIEEFKVSFIVVSSELPEIIGLCNRVIVMRNGQIMGILQQEELSEKNLIYLATGVRGGE